MKKVLKKYTFQKHERSTKKYTSQKHERSTKKVYFFSAFGKFLIYMLRVFFSEVLKKYTSQKHERSTKKVYFSEARKKN